MGGKKRNQNKDKDKPTFSAPAKASGGAYARDNSDISDLESIAYSSVAGDYSNDDEDVNDAVVLYDSFSQQIEDGQDKRIGTRMKALDNIQIILKKFYMADSIEKWKLSLCELIEKNLKRTHDEVVRSCAIAALVSIQMGMDIEEEVIGSLNIMRQVVSDASVPENVRSLCAQAIGICCYFSVEQLATQQECLLTLRQIWWQMKPTTASPGLFSSAIFSWVLLLERVHPQVVLKTIEDTQPKLCTFLAATTVDVRISAGEALAVLFEIAVNDIDEEFRFANHEYLKDVLGELAIDSAKHHAKRDKKVQKFSFRQINDAIFNNSPPQSRVRYNKHETLQVEGCHSKLLYDSLCQLLKGDVNMHLTNNMVLREFFDLGPVLVVDEEKALSKAEKVERMNALNADSKARNIHRGKQRDKKVY